MSTGFREVKRSGGFFYGWVIVAAGFLVSFITYGSEFSFSVFLTALRESLDSTTAIVSGAYSLSMFLYMAVGLFAGWCVDRYGPKITTLLGGLFLGSGFLLTSQIDSTWQLYLTYVLIGVGMSPAYSPLMTTITRWFVRRRGLALGIFSAGIGAGPLVLVPLASYLNSIGGWRFAFLVIGSTASLIIVAAFFMKRRPEEVGSPPDGMSYYTENQVPEANTMKAVSSPSRDLSPKEAIGTRTFWLLASVYLLIGTGIQMVLAHIVAYSQGKGIAPLTAATVVSTLSGVSIAGRIIMGIASDWFGRKRALVLCLGIEGIMILWLIPASASWMFFLFGVVYGFAYGGHVPQIPALVGETFGLAYMGTVLGAAGFFYGVGGAIGPVLAGYIVDITGSYSIAFAVGGMAMLIAAALTYLVKRPDLRASKRDFSTAYR